MDPGTLLVIALLYLATETGKKVGEKVSSAASETIFKAATRAKQIVFDGVRSQPQQLRTLQDFEARPNDPASVRRLFLMITKLRRDDTHLRYELDELKGRVDAAVVESADIRVLLENVERKVRDLAQSSIGVKEFRTVPSPGRIEVNPTTNGPSGEILSGYLAQIADHVPVEFMQAAIGNLEDLRDLLSVTFEGSTDPTSVLDHAQKSIQLTTDAMNALVSFRKSIEDYRSLL
jgi:hypothetical protein